MLRSAPLVNKYKFIVVFSGLLAGLSHTVQAYGFNSGGGAAVEISGVVAIPDGRGLRKLRVILPKGSHHSYDQGHYPILRQGGKADNSRVFRFCQPGSPLAPESSETCQSILLLSRNALEIEVRDETEAVAGDADLVSILAGSFVQLLNSAGAYLPFRPKPPELPDPGVSLPGNSPAPMNGNPGNPDVPSFPPGWPGQNPRFLLDTKNSPSLLELFPQPVMVQQNGPEAEWQGENAEEAVLTHFDARGGFARVQVPQDYKLVDPLQMQPEQPVRSLGFQPQAIEQRLPGGVLTEAVNSQGDTVYIIRESNGQIRILSPSQMANLMASVAYSKLEAAGLGDVNYVEFKDITRPYTRPVPDQPPLKGKKPRGEPDNPSAGPVFEPETRGMVKQKLADTQADNIRPVTPHPEPDSTTAPPVKRAKRSHPKGQLKFVCPVDGCDKRYVNRRLLSRHQKQSHPKGQLKFVCPVDGCDERYVNRRLLSRHQKQLHPKGQLKFVCPEDGCDKRYVTQRQLTRHQEQLHPKGQLEFVCPVDDCGNKFARQGPLNQHLKRSHPKDSQLVFVCNCGAKYAERGLLAQHQKHSHPKTSRLRFECDCGGRFVAQWLLDQHQRRLHPGDDQLKFVCPVDGCVDKYAEKWMLTRHIQSKHEK